MSQLDLVIRNGRVVTAGSEAVVDVGIADGRIAQFGGEMSAATEIEATGKRLRPGVIDAHVHLTSAPGGPTGGPRWVDDFTSGSAAALAGGVTSLGNMTFPGAGETPLASLARDGALAAEQASADYFLHPVLVDLTDEALDEIPQLLGQGCNTIKYFMSMSGFDRQIGRYVEATRRAGASRLLTMIHCEDFALLADAVADLTRAGKTSLRHYGATRPIVSEVVATQRAVAIAEATGAPVYVVHLSCERALAVCAEAQARGLPLYVETRPLYLHLTSERLAEPDGAKYVGQPPLREPGDVAAIWHGLQSGTVHTVCTDHAPWSLAAKLDPDLSIARLRPGTENLQTMLPMLYSEGVRTGRLSLGRLVEVTATNTAKLFGLYPRKGTIAVGGDADIVVFDPGLTRTIDNAMLKSNCDYSVYEGWSVTGWPVITLRRGEIACRDDTVLAQPGSGQLLARGATQPL
jgi:dihydropyrimidinase